jgi:hypothetical protein
MDAFNPAVDPNLTPTHLSTWGEFICGYSIWNIGSVLAASAGWGTGNQATIMPMFLPWNYNVARAFWMNGSSTGGNSDIGIFTEGGTKLWSSGSVANSGNSVKQFVNVNMLLNAGSYYLAFVHSINSSNHVWLASPTAGNSRMSGIYIQSSALPLPSPLTPAVSSTPSIPLAGLTRLASGF